MNLKNKISRVWSDQCLLERATEGNIFLGQCWYEIFCRNVGDLNGEVRFYCLFDDDHNALAVFPMWLQSQTKYGLKFNRLSSLTNYYSPIFNIAVNSEVITRESALSFFLQAINMNRDSWDLIEIFPIEDKFKNAVFGAAKQNRMPTFPYWMTKKFLSTD